MCVCVCAPFQAWALAIQLFLLPWGDWVAGHPLPSLSPSQEIPRAELTASPSQIRGQARSMRSGAQRARQRERPLVGCTDGQIKARLFVGGVASLGG